MIFTDPAAMGLFFMGAIVLFEKSERVLNSIAVSPVKAWEYVLSKLVSIGIVSTLVGLVIGISAGIVQKPLLFISGVFLCSCLFSAVALTIARGISTLNQFMLATIPAEILIVLPAIFLAFLVSKKLDFAAPRRQYDGAVYRRWRRIDRVCIPAAMDGAVYRRRMQDGEQNAQSVGGSSYETAAARCFPCSCARFRRTACFTRF